MGGGCGAGKIAAYTRSITEHRPNTQLVILCGHNEKLRRSLETARWLPSSARVLGFILNPCDYIDASNVVVSKAGPSSIFEVAHRQRQLFLTEERGHQERGNAAFARDNNWGTVVRDEPELGRAIAAAECCDPRSTMRAHPGDGGAELARILKGFLSYPDPAVAG